VFLLDLGLLYYLVPNESIEKSSSCLFRYSSTEDLLISESFISTLPTFFDFLQLSSSTFTRSLIFYFSSFLSLFLRVVLLDMAGCLLSGFLGKLRSNYLDEIFDDDAKCIVNIPQVSYHLLSLALGSEMVDRQLRISINIFVDIVNRQRVSHLNNIRSKSNK
jgi:hypothetical protein